MSIDTTSASVPARDQARELLDQEAGGRPIWVRAPINCHERYTGLTRAKLYELAAKGHIRSVSLRDPGRIKGCRLFHLQSILDYIARIEAATDDPASRPA